MNIEEIRNYCLSKPLVTESFPFDEHTLVFKVAGKMFALASLERIPLTVNLKADPDYSQELRATHPEAIIPGFHMNKKHWNTVTPSALTTAFVIKLVDHSYDSVVVKLPKKIRILKEQSNG